MVTLNSSAIDSLFEQRRSVFQKDYLPDALRDSDVERILNHAVLAPTHKMTEPWHFVVFSGDGRKKLADFQSECYKEVTQRNGSFREQRYESLRTKPMESSHIIAIGMKRSTHVEIPEQEELGAVFCAIENMYLSASAAGIGCYLSTGGVTYFDEAKSFFGLGDRDRLLGFMHLGKPRQWPVPKARKPWTEKTTWIKS